MKKAYIIMGIAFALIVATIASCTSKSTEPEKKTVGIIMIDNETVAEYLQESYPESTIENVNVLSVEESKDYGGYAADITFDRDGDHVYTRVSTTSIAAQMA